MHSFRTVIAGFVLVLLAGKALATTFYMPVPIAKQDVYSRNQAFVLDVNPQSGVNTIYSAADRSTPLWSFPGKLNSDVRSIFLADSGLTVALVIEEESPGSSQGGEAVRFYFRDRDSISYQVSEFLEPKVSFTAGCGLPRVRWVEVAIDQGNQLVITTTEGRDFVLDYESPRLRRQLVPTRAIVVGLVVAIGIVALGRLLLRTRPLANSPAA